MTTTIIDSPINSNDETNDKINTKNNLNLTVSAMTWNLAEKKIKVINTTTTPTTSTNTTTNTTKVEDGNFIKNFKGSDIIVLGVQECENIKPRRNEGHRSTTWRKIQQSILGNDLIILNT